MRPRDEKEVVVFGSNFSLYVFLQFGNIDTVSITFQSSYS